MTTVVTTKEFFVSGILNSKFKGFNGLEQAKAWMRENHAASNTFEWVTDLKQIK